MDLKSTNVICKDVSEKFAALPIENQLFVMGYMECAYERKVREEQKKKLKPELV